MRVLLTGATGFIGSAIASFLVNEQHSLKLLVRKKDQNFDNAICQSICDFENLDDICVDFFLNTDCVIHSAALAHITSDDVIDPLILYRKVNRDATLILARLAADAEVKRFIFISSAGVNGNVSNTPFTEDDKVAPHDAYCFAKFEAEQGLFRIAQETGLEVVIVRPPLVYGPGAPGNFASLKRWVFRGLPLPLGAVNNKRSFVALDNLVDFIALCSDRKRSPNAANEVFLISDGNDISTSDFITNVAEAYGVKSRLFYVPVSLMQFAAKLLGKGKIASSLLGNFQVDSSKARELLGWRPVVSMDEQLRKIVEFEKAAGKL